MTTLRLASFLVALGWVVLLSTSAAHRSRCTTRRRQAIDRLVAPTVRPLGGSVASLAGRRGNRRRAQAEVARAVPDLVDLFELAVGGGLNVRLALELVAPRAPPPVRAALVGAAEAVAGGLRTGEALGCLPARLGEPVRPLVTALQASERYGTPLLPALHRVAAEARAGRRVRAEAAARRVPVKLLFPLVLCILPAFALLTVVPLLAGTLETLRL